MVGRSAVWIMLPLADRCQRRGCAARAASGTLARRADPDVPPDSPAAPAESCALLLLPQRCAGSRGAARAGARRQCPRRATCSGSSPATTTRSPTSGSCATYFRAARRRLRPRAARGRRDSPLKATRCSSPIISSEANLARLERYRDIARRLALVARRERRARRGRSRARARPSSGSTAACTRARWRPRSTRSVLALPRGDRRQRRDAGDSRQRHPRARAVHQSRTA